MSNTRLEVAQKQIEFARSYTMTLLDEVPDEYWFRQPSEGVTHIAWQVGHLAMAQYGLCLFRQRGRAEIDTELMSSSFRKKFSKGTTPSADADFYPTRDEILETFDRVYDQAMKEISDLTDDQLDNPIDMPYAGYATQLGALLFCSHHELIHAGQIGLIRRLLGKDPVR